MAETRTKVVLTSIEESLSSFDLSTAQPLIKALCERRFSRATRLRLAQLALRAQLAQTTIALLRPYVSLGRRRKSGRAVEPEILVYAIALSLMGTTTEAVRIFEGFDFDAFPEGASAYGFACARLWDHVTPMPVLEQALRRTSLKGRDRASAMNAFAGCLIYGRPDLQRAQALAEEAAPMARAAGDSTVFFNARQLLAQSLIHQKKWTKAGQVLSEALRDLPASGADYLRLIFLQWQEILGLYVSKERAPHLSALRKIEGEYRRLGHYGNVRYCSFFRAIAVDDFELLSRVYFGSPYPGCRARVLGALGSRAGRLPAFYDEVIGPAGRGAGERRRVNVFTGENDVSRARLKPGQARQILLEALASDFFAPANLFRLHEALYPDENFDPRLSPARVTQVVWRLRQWLQDARLPVSIREAGGHYTLEASHPLALRMPRQDAILPIVRSIQVAPRLRHVVEQLSLRFRGDWFRSSQVQALFGISDFAARRALQEAEAAALVIRDGRGSGTVYRLVHLVP